MLRKILSTIIVLGALAGVAPATSVADPGVTMNLPSGAASMKWIGAVANAKIGQMSTGGPNNGVIALGDESHADAIAVTSIATTARGAYVLGSLGKPMQDRDLAALSPQHGYLAKLSTASARIVDIGDQNDDGSHDLAIGSNNSRVYVTYQVNDVAALPECVVGGTTRCLDVAAMTSDQGYSVMDSTAGSTFGTYVGSAGDFNGDGIDDLLVGNSNFDGGRGAAYVIYGGRTANLDVAAMTAADGIQILGPAVGSLFGSTANEIGDVDGDGLGDIGVFSASTVGEIPAAVYVIYGVDGLPATIATDTFPQSAGFTVTGFAPFQMISAGPAGDVDGDGVADFLIGGPGPPIVGNPDGVATVIYGSADRSAATVSGVSPAVADGYSYVAPSEASKLGQVFGNLGDLNGDGIPDQLVSAASAAVAGSTVGAAEVLFGHRPSPADAVNVGSGLVADDGIALVGENNNGATGAGAPIGDIDRDGLPDFVVSTPSLAQSARNNAGAVYLVRGVDLIGQSLTSVAGPVDQTTATANGVVRSNGREATAYFEYGTTSGYGQVTSDQTIDGNHLNTQVQADLTGLARDTEYHYRVVVENDLGLKAYGADVSFRTDPAPDLPQGPCDATPNAAGCPGFCTVNPAAIGCAASTPGLSGLIASPGAGKVRRGGQAVVRAWITSTGTKKADGLRVCATVPKRLVSLVGSRCRSIGTVDPGATAKVQFRVKVKAKARKGAKPTIKLVASADGLTAKTANARFTVR